MGKKDNLYDALDLITTSYAESNVNKYKKILEKLPEHISDIETKITEIENELENIYTWVNSNKDSVQGEIFVVFEDKVVIVENNLNKVLENLKTAKTALQNKLDGSWMQLNIWKERAKHEDEIKKEYKRGD